VSGDRRERAYRSGAAIAKGRMKREAPEDAEALAAVEASDIIVVRGVYDHVERVLDALDMPHTAVEPEALARVKLRPEQLLVVNCPGTVEARDLPRIAGFVATGGSLFTTDWALRHVIEPAFPNTISYNNRPTHDDVVRIEIKDNDNPFLRGVIDENDDPQWWLEASSYPIRIHDPARVHVLLQSSELGTKYGEKPVAVLFGHGDGEVFHMISHYYLQRTELRAERHKADAVSWANEKGVPVTPRVAADMAGLSLGEVESAGSSARLFANVAAQKKRRSQTR
jgi:hypothetical protein